MVNSLSLRDSGGKRGGIEISLAATLVVVITFMLDPFGPASACHGSALSIRWRLLCPEEINSRAISGFNKQKMDW